MAKLGDNNPPAGQPGNFAAPFQQPAVQAPVAPPIQQGYAPAPQQYQPAPQQAPVEQYGQPQYAPQPPQGQLPFDPQTGQPVYTQPGVQPQYQPAPQAPQGFQQPAPPPMGGIAGALGQAMGGGGLSGAMGGGGLGAMLKGIDFSKIEDKVSKVLPPRDANGPIHYEAQVMSAKGANTQAGDDKIELKLTFTYPEYAKGVTIYDNLTFGDKASWKLKQALKSCGLLTPQGAFSGSSEKDMEGSVVAFQIINEEYPEGSGVFRNKVAGGYEEGTRTPGLLGVQPQQAPPQQFQQAPPVAQQVQYAQPPQQQGQPNFGQTPQG